MSAVQSSDLLQHFLSKNDPGPTNLPGCDWRWRPEAESRCLRQAAVAVLEHLTRIPALEVLDQADAASPLCLRSFDRAVKLKKIRLSRAYENHCHKKNRSGLRVQVRPA